MKIETKKIITFLTQLRMGEINTCLFKFEEDGLHINAQSDAQSHASYSFLKSSAFIEYKNIGNVGVDELGNLIQNVFKKFKKELNFSVEGNLFTVTSKEKSVNFELVDEKFVTSVNDMPTLEYDTTFSINIKQMASFIDEVGGNKDAIITFETVNDGVILSNTGKYKFKYNINSENTKGGVKCSFASPFVDALKGVLKKDIEGDLIFHIKNDHPIQVDFKTQESEICFLIAPWVNKK